LQDSHISYTKGCYTGQEIVERVRSRGQVNRQRVRLAFSGDVVPETGAALTLDGKEVGYVTRAAKPGPAARHWHGLRPQRSHCAGHSAPVRWQERDGYKVTSPAV